MKPIPNAPVACIKNLDVLGTSLKNPILAVPKGGAGELARDPLLSSLGAHTAQPRPAAVSIDGNIALAAPNTLRSRKPPTSSRRSNYAKFIGLPLVAHLTIHWAYTDVGDDPDGKLFAKFREGLDKWLRRHGIVFAAAGRVSACRVAKPRWCIAICSSTCRSSTAPRGSCQVEAAIYRLIKRHGRGYWAEQVIDLRIHDNPDGKYLIKGGGPKVWKLFRLQERASPLARHHPRQAVRHYPEYRTERQGVGRSPLIRRQGGAA